MSRRTGVDESRLSAECGVAQRPEYRHLHGMCRRTEDVPVPHTKGVVLIPRCTCTCHRYNATAVTDRKVPP